MRTSSRLAVLAVATGSLLALANPALAAHESNNSLVFGSVAGSSAVGSGTINYVKGASVEGDEEQTVWQQSLSFTGLTSGTAYRVVVKNADDGNNAPDATAGPGNADRVICSFTAVDAAGTCSGRFLELRALGVAQLQVGTTVVAQATRLAGGPGSIVSQGGNREK